MTVPAETQRIAVQLDADDRLAAAVGGVARYVADAAGLDGPAVAEWQAAVVAACRQEFTQLPAGETRLQVALVRTSERLEAALTRRVSAASEKKQLDGQGSVPGVDKVERETRPNAVVTRLTKFVNPSGATT